MSLKVDSQAKIPVVFRNNTESPTVKTKVTSPKSGTVGSPTSPKSELSVISS